MPATDIRYRPIDLSDDGLTRACAFLNLVFPRARHYSVAFLEWLYRRNPDGLAMGIEGFDGEKLVAHLAAVPQQTRLKGEARRVVLWVNGATHPDYRGQGLYLKLCTETCTALADRGVNAIIGVANQNTIRAYESKLGIQNVAGLQVRIGIGNFLRIRWDLAEEAAELRRIWAPEALAWRLNNPSNRLTLMRGTHQALVLGATQNALIQVFAPIPTTMAAIVPGIESVGRGRRPFQLSLGLEPRGSAQYGLSAILPDRLKPSPLRLIYRNLHNGSDRLDPEQILFSFLDFDAY